MIDLPAYALIIFLSSGPMVLAHYTGEGAAGKCVSVGQRITARHLDERRRGERLPALPGFLRAHCELVSR